MSESTSESSTQATMLLIAGLGVALIVALLAFGPGGFAEHPALVGPLLLVPALVFALSVRLWRTALVVLIVLVGLGVLDSTGWGSLQLRWWLSGGVAAVLVATSVFVFPSLLEPPDEDETSEEEVLLAAGLRDRIVSRPLVDLFLDRQVAAAKRGEDLSVVLFQLDGYDGFLQEYGGDAAEQLLEKLDDAFRETVRDSDVVGRYGREQFLTLLLGEDTRGAYMYAKRVQQKLSRLAIKGPDGSLIDSGITMSTGIASYSEDLATPEDLVQAARRTADKAAAEGGGRILVAGKEPRE